MRFDQLWLNASIATMVPGGVAYGAIPDGAVGTKDGRIAFVGSRSALEEASEAQAREVIDCRGGWVTPGLIDCHTHLMFGGNRSDEFERLLKGDTYEQILRAGGGIAATVRRTEALTASELFEIGLSRLRQWRTGGATTVEIKSGYGASLEQDVQHLRAIRRLGATGEADVLSTFLAHLPPAGRDRQPYLEQLCEDSLPAIASAGLADFVDVFCERIAFSVEESRRILAAAGKLGLRLKMHAEQLSNSGASLLAAEMGAVSADHLEFIGDREAGALAKAGVVAVLLPGAFHFLRGDRRVPVALLRHRRVTIAVATDFNPGSSPVASLLLAMNLACVHFGLTPEEAVLGVTRNAAQALGLRDRGSLFVGAVAHLVLWPVPPSELPYWMGAIAPLRVSYGRADESRNTP